MIDRDIVTQIASRFSLPAPLVAALENRTPNPGLLITYGLDEKQVRDDPTALITVMAHAVATSFAQHGSLESALSHVFAGDPNAHMSPTSPVGGLVISTLSDAASRLGQFTEQSRPANPQHFGKIGQDFGRFLTETRNLGGNVTDDHLNFWTAHMAPYVPREEPRAQRGGSLNAPMPQGPTPKHVEDFAGEMKSLGIDVDHFMQHFPQYSALRYKLLAVKTSLKDYAPVSTMQPHEMVQHVRSQPHPTYPHLTAGEYADMHDVATLHSLKHQGEPTPPPAAVSRLASARAKWSEVSDYFQPASQ